MSATGSEHVLSGAIHARFCPTGLWRRVVAEIVELIGAADGAAVGLVGRTQVTYVAAAGAMGDGVGAKLSLEASLAGLAARTGETLYAEDCRHDPRVARRKCEAFSTLSLVCVPLKRGSESVGVLEVMARHPRAFTAEDLATLSRISEFVSATVIASWDTARAAGELIGAARGEIAAGGSPGSGFAAFVANVLEPGLLDEVQTRHRIEAVVAERAFHTVFQPIVDVPRGRLVGVEALTRFPGPPDQPTERWFEQAPRVGLGAALELACARAALDQLDRLPRSAFLAINVSPEAIMGGELPALLAGRQCDRVVLEVTEHLSVQDYGTFRAVLESIRACGVRLAIDDLGAGFASLAHIANLAPDTIKLDRQFGSGIDQDPARRAVAQALVSLARDLHTELIAEGIETRGELETVRELGIPLIQGYLVSPPVAAESLPDHFTHVRRWSRPAPRPVRVAVAKPA